MGRAVIRVCPRRDGHWIVEPAEALIVERIFRLRVERGYSYSKIARLLHKDGVPTRRNANWSPTTVRRILTEPTVLGLYQHAGAWLPGRHPAIVTSEAWQEAQALAEQGLKYAPRGAGRLPKRHLFTRGMLRCGACGEAMLPRSDGDVYVCRTRRVLKGKDGCPVPPIKRALIETAALSLFERLALDVDATRERLAGAMSERLGEIEPHIARAAREAVEQESRLYKIEDDYFAERLDAVAYSALRAKVIEALAAARAEHERLDAQSQMVRAGAAAIDAEGETLRRLAELRQNISARVADASAHGDVEALRAAIGAIFEVVYLRPAEHQITTVEGYAESAERISGGEFYVEPNLRADVVKDYTADGAHVFTRVPLPLEPPSINQTSSPVILRPACVL